MKNLLLLAFLGQNTNYQKKKKNYLHSGNEGYRPTQEHTLWLVLLQATMKDKDGRGIFSHNSLFLPEYVRLLSILCEIVRDVRKYTMKSHKRRLREGRFILIIR